MSHLTDNINAENVAEQTVRFSLVSIFVSGLIYCVALLA